MYICIDVGGTKTLIASFDDDGNIVEKQKIPTAQDYSQFLVDVRQVVESFKNREFKAGAIGIPATNINRIEGTAARFGNLPWQNISFAKDIGEITNCKIYVENDAKLAGLSEAKLVNDQFKKVLYMTVSTGIGISVIENMVIDTAAGDSGGRLLLVKHEGIDVPWESFASGKAITARYGKMAKDIEDEQTWRSISKDLAVGLVQFLAIFQPEVVIVGGSVGEYFEKFGSYLSEDIDNYHLPLFDLPKFIGAQRPEEAGIYGCYELAKQKESHG